MLASSKLQTIVWTSRIPDAERFYSDVLGLPLKGKSHGDDARRCQGRMVPRPGRQSSVRRAICMSSRLATERRAVLTL
jgi:catechol 2,3-dioxygenase-like lactoylglutathione lyase family enzyme